MLLVVALGVLFLILFGLALAAVSAARVGQVTGDSFGPEFQSRTSGA
jgi:hypothetical protein